MIGSDEITDLAISNLHFREAPPFKPSVPLMLPNTSGLRPENAIKAIEALALSMVVASLPLAKFLNHLLKVESSSR